MTPEASGVDGLLASDEGNGVCIAWASFLVHVLGAQGLEAWQYEVKPIAPSDLIAVKNWSFLNPPDLSTGEYRHIYGSKALPLPGMPGQQNDNPPYAFNKHVIVRLGADLYDPSYGTSKIPGANGNPNVKLYEDSSFSGYAKDPLYRPNDITPQSGSEVTGEDIPSDG